MPIIPLRRVERDQNRINEAIISIMEGRSNAHGTFAINNNNVATSTVVTALTCSSDSHISFTPIDSNAGNLWPVWIVAGKRSFTFYHPATANACNYTYSICG